MEYHSTQMVLSLEGQIAAVKFGTKELMKHIKEMGLQPN